MDTKITTQLASALTALLSVTQHPSEYSQEDKLKAETMAERALNKYKRTKKNKEATK